MLVARRRRRDRRPGADRIGSPPGARFWRALPHRQRRHCRLAIFSAIPYKTPWNLLPFYAGDVRARRRRVLGARERRAASARGARRPGSARSRSDPPPRLAGVARVGHLRRRPAQPVRLRADRPRRRPHGGAHPRSRRPASRWRADAGVGDCAAVTNNGRCPGTCGRCRTSATGRPRRRAWRCRRRSSSLRSTTRHALDAALGDRYVSEFFGLRPERAPGALHRARDCGIASWRSACRDARLVRRWQSTAPQRTNAAFAETSIPGVAAGRSARIQ